VNDLDPPAIVRSARDLAVLAAQIKADLAGEKNALRESSERARRAGENLKLAREELAPRHRWNAWLKEQGIPVERAAERIRIADNWSSIPAEIANSGVSRVLEFLRPAPAGTESAPPDPSRTSTTWKDVGKFPMSRRARRPRGGRSRRRIATALRIVWPSGRPPTRGCRRTFGEPSATTRSRPGSP
jgi:hypothetical protein